VQLKLKVETKELLPRNLEYSSKFNCLAYSTENTKLKIVRFISKVFRKEKKKGVYDLSLRDMNSDNLFCPIKKISFRKVFFIKTNYYEV
jgi:hypothetical protein